MSTENAQKEEQINIESKEEQKLPENTETKEESSNLSEIKIITPDSADIIKNMVTIPSDKISKIDEIYENAEEYNNLNEEHIIIKKIPRKTITTTTTTTRIITTTIIKNGVETSTTKTEKTTKVENNKQGNNNEDIVIKEIIMEDNSKNKNSGNIEIQNKEINIENNYHENNDINMDNSDENYNKENKKEYIIKEEYNIINNNDNNNNEIIIEENNKVKNDNIDNINKEETKTKTLTFDNSTVSFGAPAQINNYNSNLLLNPTFGFKNKEEKDEILIKETINMPETNINKAGIKFGYNPDNNNKEKEHLVVLNDKIKFGFMGNEANKEIEIKEDNNNKIEEIAENKEIINNEIDMDIEPGEIKQEENKEINLEPGEIKQEENKEIIIEQKENKNIKKESLFSKSLFDDNTNNNQSSSIFNMKLFNLNNENNDTQNNIQQSTINNDKSLFGDLFKSEKINSISDNKNIQEIFLNNNKSLMPNENNNTTTESMTTQNIFINSNNNNNNNSQIPSATFGVQSSEATESNQPKLKTMNEMIREGSIFDADSAKKTKDNNIIFSNINTNINSGNQDSNATNTIQYQVVNTKQNPFKINEPKIIAIPNTINENENMDTNESTFNQQQQPFFNMDNDKKISSPLGDYAKNNMGNCFISLDKKVNEISVNPIYTNINNFNDDNYTNPFNSILDKNKNKDENKEKEKENDTIIKSNLFPGLEQINNQSNETKKINIIPKPKFPGSVSEVNVQKTKTSLFIDNNDNDNKNEKEHKDTIEDNKEINEDNKESNNEEEKEKENIMISNIISIGTPGEIKEKISMQIDNNENNKNDINKENINSNDIEIIKDSNIQNSNLPELSSLIINKGQKEQKEENMEDKNKDIIESINLEQKNEEIFSISKENNTSDNKENEIPKEDKEEKSNINLNMQTSSLNKSSFENLNKSENNNSMDINNKEKPKQKKSLFNNLFSNNQNENLDDIFNKLNKNKTAILFSEKQSINNKHENINLFGNNGGNPLLINDNKNLKFFDKDTTPIKTSSLFNPPKENKKQEDKTEDITETKEIKEINDIKEDKPKKEEIKNPNIEININMDNKPETKFGEEESESEDGLSEYEIEYTPGININDDDKGKEKKEISALISNVNKEKPFDIKYYLELIKKIYIITEKRKNKIIIPEKKSVTKYDDTLTEFLADFDKSIKNLKHYYILTLVKIQIAKDDEEKRKIIIQSNLPKLRNKVKKVYKEMTRVIKKNLEQENKKYYYILILNILKKYDNISDEEIKKALEIYKNKPRRSKRIKDKSGKDEVKHEIKEKNEKSISYQKKKCSFDFTTLFSILIALGFIAYFYLVNWK